MEFVSKYQKEITALRKNLRELEALAQKEKREKENELISQGWILIHVDENPYDHSPEIHFLLSPDVSEEVIQSAEASWFDFEEEGLTKDQYFI